MSTLFSIILVAITLGSGLIWLLDSLLFAPKRRERVAAAVASAGGELDAKATDKAAGEPWLVETSRSIFPVIAFVLVLRSFLYEPFQIPSGSMMPTLLVGDFILVEKFSYGIKDPVFRSTLVETGKPQRGDIAVFKFPLDPRVDYIKRVIGLPGDRIVYRDKTFYIQPKCEQGMSQEACQMVRIPLKGGQASEFTYGPVSLREYREDLLGTEHRVLHNPLAPQLTSRYYRQPGAAANQWVVPQGHYFMVGDNRDNSTDSRFWGFMPEENLVGKAVAVWMSLEFERDENSMLPSWIPTGVRFGRIGGIE